MAEDRIIYRALPTILDFHLSQARIRCMVGPVGSGKTSGAANEIGYYLPMRLYRRYGIEHTKWVVVRNVYRELTDTTQQTIFEWFPWGHHNKAKETYDLSYPDGPSLTLMFRACDQKKHIRQFKSLEVTGYWIDESIEVAQELKSMLRNRIGRYPRVRCLDCKARFYEAEYFTDANGDRDARYRCPACGHVLEPDIPLKYGIETTNPPDVEHPTYAEFDWGKRPPPGPVPDGAPKKGYMGFWQPPRENEANLPLRYYEDLIEDYADQRDWAEMYVDGKPGMIVKGKLVYANFKRSAHVAEAPLVYANGPLTLGWDNSGNCPAAVLVQIPSAGRVQVLREYHTDKANIIDFTAQTLARIREEFGDGVELTEWADPAGENQFSDRRGGLTSNAQLMRDECGADPKPSEQNFTARVNAVDKLLGIEDGLLIDPGCVRLINGFLGGYHYPEVGVGTGIYRDKPEKNRFSHPHDALQYIAVKVALADHDSLIDPLDLSRCVRRAA